MSTRRAQQMTADMVPLNIEGKIKSSEEGHTADA